MADLIAQGELEQHRWRRPLPVGTPVLLGRREGGWGVPWDPRISRRHARLHFDGNVLTVVRLPEAKNPVYHHGREKDEIEVRPGDSFVIGRTTFSLIDQRASIAIDVPPPVEEQAYTASSLREVSFRNPDHRLEVLSRLPDVLSSGRDDRERYDRLVNMLLTGIPAADAAAVVSLEGDRPDSETPVRLEHWDRRLSASGEFQPSRGLILDACRSGRSVVHIWRHTHDVRPAYTARQDIDWAACTPVLLEGKPRWALYVAGNFRRPASELSDSTTHDLREDVKFLELTAGIFAAVQRIRALERRETVLSRFLSPVILESIAGENPDEILSPRETEVTVIFSDLRGFSLETERWSDNLLKLLARVGDALGVMTRHILDNGGVIGDFQGDAAMGFWGWPIEQDDRIASAAKAALGMRREFESRANSTSEEHATFRVGIGIATGRAVAGKIGTADHAKVSVFGPVVNLASRLEGMTKLLHAPVLLDEATARLVRETVPSEVARVRRLASVRPYGMDASLVVSELVPPYHEFPLLNETHLRCCDEAVEAFIAGDWNTAYDLLRRMPSEDRGTDFLMVHIAQHNRTPPDDWDGAVRLAVK